MVRYLARPSTCRVSGDLGLNQSRIEEEK